jgi:hypothetical protein
MGTVYTEIVLLFCMKEIGKYSEKEGSEEWAWLVCLSANTIAQRTAHV